MDNIVVSRRFEWSLGKVDADVTTAAGQIIKSQWIKASWIRQVKLI